VLIFKASGVFNFSQGAMVLFAALAMARFAEWVPQWIGIDNITVAGSAIGPSCGNGMVEAGEACDTGLLNGTVPVTGTLSP
jgi:branched-subunit amino acid ABC-type transport system permease component